MAGYAEGREFARVVVYGKVVSSRAGEKNTQIINYRLFKIKHLGLGNPLSYGGKTRPELGPQGLEPNVPTYLNQLANHIPHLHESPHISSSYSS